MSTDQKAKLTIRDPVTPAVLNRLSQLANARSGLAEQLLDMERERVRVLVESQMVDEERKKLFGRELADRGLPPDAQISIDAKTGLIEVLQPESQSPPVEASEARA